MSILPIIKLPKFKNKYRVEPFHKIILPVEREVMYRVMPSTVNFIKQQMYNDLYFENLLIVSPQSVSI